MQGPREIYIRATGRVLHIEVVAVIAGRRHHIELDDLSFGGYGGVAGRIGVVVVRVLAKVCGGEEGALYAFSG